jgi:hypothetical protein
VWCICVQNLNSDRVGRTDTLETLLQAIEHAFNGVGTESPSVRHESLAALGKLIIQCPTVIKTPSTMRIFIPIVARSLLDEVDKVREKAYVVLALTLNHLQNPTSGILHVPETISDLLSTEVSQHLLTQLNLKLNEGKEMVAIRAWGYYVVLLGRSIIKHSLINPLLKIPSRTFQSAECDVRAETFYAWKYLIDNFVQQPNSLSIPKRLALLVTPLTVCLTTEKEDKVRVAGFRSWIYLLQCLGAQIPVLQVWDTAVAPCIDLFLKDDQTPCSNANNNNNTNTKEEIKCALLHLLVHMLRFSSSDCQKSSSSHEITTNLPIPFSLKSLPTGLSFSKEFWSLKLHSWLEWIHLFLSDIDLFKKREKEITSLVSELWRCILHRLLIILNKPIGMFRFHSLFKESEFFSAF